MCVHLFFLIRWRSHLIINVKQMTLQEEGNQLLGQFLLEVRSKRFKYLCDLLFKSSSQFCSVTYCFYLRASLHSEKDRLFNSLGAYSGTLSRRDFSRLKATLGKFDQNVMRCKVT